MTFAEEHVRLLAEYRRLMEEEQLLWETISQFVAADANDEAAQLDMARWAQVRRQRAELDKAIDALTGAAAA